MRRCLFGSALLTIACSAFGAELVFERDVKPIFQHKCWGCHGPVQQNGSLRLDERDRAMISGRGEPAIVPGSSYQSLLYRRISSTQFGPQMPITGPLSPQEIATIKAWIDQGAKWPDEPQQAKPSWPPNPGLDALLDRIHAGGSAPVRQAVANDPQLVNARSAAGRTLLIQAALFGAASDVRWLLAHGADPNLADSNGVTALMMAIEDAGRVRALLEAGAKVNARSRDGQTAILIASEQAANAAVVKLLLDHGAKAAADAGSDPLVMAAHNVDPESMQALALKRDGRLPNGALTGAGYSECLPCVQMVLAKGADRNAITIALRNAATTAPLPLLRTLLAAGADVNAKDYRGGTALMNAANCDYAEPERVKLLLDHGADINARANNGDTALRIAKRKGDTAVVKLLVSRGATE